MHPCPPDVYPHPLITLAAAREQAGVIRRAARKGQVPIKKVTFRQALMTPASVQPFTRRARRTLSTASCPVGNDATFRHAQKNQIGET